MDFKEQLVQALSESVIELFTSTFSLMANMEEIPEIFKVTQKGVIASIGFTGSIEGTIVIVCSDAVACKMVSAMLGSEIREVNQDVYDGVGEIVNIAAGGFKRRSDTVKDLVLSIPSVIRIGNDASIEKWRNANPIYLAVECGEFKFNLIFSYLIDGNKDNSQRQNLSQEKKKEAEAALKKII